MKKHALLFSLITLLFLSQGSHSFCGFYVAKADSKLFNQSSRVVMTRDGDRTVLTMSNDFKGDVRDFAVVIPVPTFLEREQIHITNNALLDHLDSYSAPRLVEYFDEDPCMLRIMKRGMVATAPMEDTEIQRQAEALGVTIEASYTVGEYDILILSAKQSNGLITWLKQNGYRIPEGAEPVVNSYLKQDMRFFVAKVNLEEQAKLGFSNLRPIQVAFESPKFMLPIRLGMINAEGPQELFIYTLTRKGRVETTNYRTVKIPTGMELPEFIKNNFGNFYQDMFNTQVEKENRRAVFLEYAWDMNWCDPCAADPLSDQELKELGVFWIPDPMLPNDPPTTRKIMPQPKEVFITRLHVRYDQQHFPEDLFFQETGDRQNFQARYVIRHPWKGETNCPAAEEYQEKILPRRQQEEIKTLATLTGWDIHSIRKKIPGIKPVEEVPWWKKLWDD